MKTFKLFFVAVIAIVIHISCSSQNNNQANQAAVSQDEVTVYYFHFERRCVTCKAVEQVSREAVAELYNDAVTFRAYNLDEPEGKEAGEKIGVSGQSLLVVKGDNKIDLTAQGFMNATTKPEELKKILKENIDPLLQ